MNDDSKGFFRFLVLELFNGILSLLGSLPLIGAPFRWLQRNPAYALLGIFYYFCFRLSGTEAYLKQDYENCRQHQQQHRHTKSWHCDDGYRIQRLFLNRNGPLFYLILIGGTALGVLIIRRQQREETEGWQSEASASTEGSASPGPAGEKHER